MRIQKIKIEHNETDAIITFIDSDLNLKDHILEKNGSIRDTLRKSLGMIREKILLVHKEVEFDISIRKLK